MKDTFYFPHDSNAVQDPKCAALIKDFGIQAYGFYWMLIELLHSQREGKLEKFPKLYDGIAQSFRIDTELVKKLIEALLQDYNLLHQDEKYIWSERVLRNLEERKSKYEAKVHAGRLGGIKSGISRNLNVIPKQNEAAVEANEQNKIKIKEIKVNKIHSAFSFDPLWKDYPRKDGRKEAERHFHATVKTEKDYQDIQLALKNFCEAMKGREMQYIKNGSTWFNNWRDWIVMPVGVVAAQKRELKPKDNCTVCGGSGKLPDRPGRCWCFS